VRCADPIVVAVNALDITQITARGTSCYCLASSPNRSSPRPA